MGFWNKILSGRLFSDPPTIVAELELDNRKYILNTFNLEFAEQTYKNHLYNGLITLSTSDIFHKTIGHWVVFSEDRRSGYIRFYENSTKLENGNLFEICFIDAICINYRKTVEKDGKLSQTHLTIAPRNMKIGKEYVENLL